MRTDASTIVVPPAIHIWVTEKDGNQTDYFAEFPGLSFNIEIMLKERRWWPFKYGRFKVTWFHWGGELR